MKEGTFLTFGWLLHFLQLLDSDCLHGVTFTIVYSLQLTALNISIYLKNKKLKNYILTAHPFFTFHTFIVVLQRGCKSNFY